ncbi:uncharacterized protein KD926_010948 [Aspergillus affinis]|uniref:uncharacterized protein n=1 Tax=Aspergillus affinis TaxID=1070780 RepID=UPI0022FE8691|nr:uncharacterized protein KD926_010948 [Aspergillus affinis]KAI9038292.1 hypothetical protein KD926_010948 [Aspergillus affinis]
MPAQKGNVEILMSRSGPQGTATDLQALRSAVMGSSLPARRVILRACLARLPRRRQKSGKAPESKTQIWQLSEANSKIRALESLIAARDNLQRLGHSAPGQASPRTGISLSLGDSYLLDTHHVETALATFRQHIAYCGPGVPYFSLRAYFYSAVSERTGSDLNLDLFLHQVAESYKLHHHVEELRPIPQKWPTPQLIQQCIDHFSRSGFYSVFPIVDTTVLRELLNAGIMDNPTDPTHTANCACLVAFTALVTELHRLEPAFVNADPDAYL